MRYRHCILMSCGLFGDGLSENREKSASRYRRRSQSSHILFSGLDPTRRFAKVALFEKSGLALHS